MTTEGPRYLVIKLWVLRHAGTVISLSLSYKLYHKEDERSKYSVGGSDPQESLKAAGRLSSVGGREDLLWGAPWLCPGHSRLAPCPGHPGLAPCPYPPDLKPPAASLLPRLPHPQSWPMWWVSDTWPSPGAPEIMRVSLLFLVKRRRRESQGTRMENRIVTIIKHWKIYRDIDLCIWMKSWFLWISGSEYCLGCTVFQSLQEIWKNSCHDFRRTRKTSEPSGRCEGTQLCDRCEGTQGRSPYVKEQVIYLINIHESCRHMVDSCPVIYLFYYFICVRVVTHNFSVCLNLNIKVILLRLSRRWVMGQVVAGGWCCWDISAAVSTFPTNLITSFTTVYICSECVPYF